MLYYFETFCETDTFNAKSDEEAVEYCKGNNEILFCYRYLEEDGDYVTIYDIT
jgi:hypothetical protein